MTAQEIHNKIMAFNSWPIAETTLSGERIRIYDSKYNENDIIGIPGNIKSYENNIEVFTKKGTLSILSLQKENSKVLGVKDFLNSNDLSGKKFKRNKTGFGMNRKWLREAVSEYIDKDIPGKEEIYFLEKLIQNRL